MLTSYRLALFLALSVSLLALATPATPLHADTGCPTTIAFGETLLCSLSTPGEVASFSFSANGGDRIVARMGRRTSEVSPHIQVQAPGGSVVCEAYSYNAAVDTSACLLPSSGTYNILARNYNSTNTGGYALALQRLNAPTGASPLNFGETVPATVVMAGELDAYTFTASAGDTVLARVGSGTSPLSPHIRLFGPDGIKLCEAYNGNRVALDIPACLLPTDGSYTIVVNDYAGVDVGSYGVSLQRVNAPGNAAPLAFGEMLLATTAQLGETDTYTFTASTQDSVVVRVGSSSDGWTPHIRLYGPAGIKLCETYNGNYTALDIPGCLLPTDGSYTIVVNNYNAALSGNYGIMLQRVNNPSGGTALAFGTNNLATIGAAGELDTYTFTAMSGDTVIMRMGSTAFGVMPHLRLYGPDGVKVCEAYNNEIADASGCILPSSGSYTILASPRASARTGAYGIALQRLNNPSDAIELKYRWPTSGTIAVTGGLATYAFSATANSSVAIQASSPNNTIYPFLRLHAPDGTQLCEAHGYSSGVAISSCPLPSDGAYTLTVSNYGGAETGDFALFLRCLADSCGPTDLPVFNVYLPSTRSQN
jgi:hypothetical protein